MEQPRGAHTRVLSGGSCGRPCVCLSVGGRQELVPPGLAWPLNSSGGAASTSTHQLHGSAASARRNSVRSLPVLISLLLLSCGPH